MTNEEVERMLDSWCDDPGWRRNLVPRPNLVPPRPGRTDGPRPLVPSYRDEDEGRTQGRPSEPTLRDELDARFQASVAAYAARQEQRRRDRTETLQRRAHGLRARHAAKERRADERLRQAQQDGPDDSWWEEP